MGELAVDVKITLKYILETEFEGVNRINLDQDRLVAGSCKHGDEFQNFIKGGNICEQLNEYYVVKKNSAS